MSQGFWGFVGMERQNVAVDKNIYQGQKVGIENQSWLGEFSFLCLQ